MISIKAFRLTRSYALFFAFTFFLFTACKNKTERANKEQIEETNTTEATVENSKVILFFGDSLTAGYGLEEGEAFPEIIQEKIDSLGLNYKVVNAGLSGETTSGGKNRIDWVLKQNVDIFVLELGANDGLRGIPLSETRKNLKDIIEFVKGKNPDIKIILAGMQIPPNMGQDYTTEFRNIFLDLAEKYDLELIPFLLEGVAGNPALNLQDGIHPTAEGHEILANNVWEVLAPVIKE